MGLARTVNEQIFRHIHGKNLVYNTCWEDPRCDRQLLHLGPNSRVVMLTSAGCNALDYLLDDPAVVHCVDLNPRQNALLELKITLFQGADHAALFRFFGDGVAEDARALFQNSLQEHLPEGFSRNWWSRNLHVFSGRGMRRSFSRRLRLFEKPYGAGQFHLPEPADIVLFSYALTMFNPGWEAAIEQARQDLKPGGRIAVVDFHDTPFAWFRRWMGYNHVRMEQHLLPVLEEHFETKTRIVRKAWGGLWRYFIFIGEKPLLHG